MLKTAGIVKEHKSRKNLATEAVGNDFAYDSEGWLLPEGARDFAEVSVTVPVFNVKSVLSPAYLGKAARGTVSKPLTFVSGTTWTVDPSSYTIDRSQPSVISVFWWDTTNSKFRAATCAVADVTKSDLQSVFSDEFIDYASNAVIPGIEYKIKYPTIAASSAFVVKYVRSGSPISALGSGTVDPLHPGFYKLFEGANQVGWFNTEGSFYLDFTLVGAPDEGSNITCDYVCDLFTFSSISNSDITITLNPSYDGTTPYAIWRTTDDLEYCGNGVESFYHVVNRHGSGAGVRFANDYTNEVEKIYSMASIAASEGESRIVSFYARKLQATDCHVYIGVYSKNGTLLSFGKTPEILSGTGTVTGGNTVDFTLSEVSERFAVKINVPAGGYLIGFETSSPTGNIGTNQILFTSVQSYIGTGLAPYIASSFVDYIPRPGYQLNTGIESVIGRASELLLADGQGGTYWGTISGSGLAITSINGLSATSQTIDVQTVTDNVNPNFQSSVATHMLSLLETDTQWDTDFDIVGTLSHPTYGTTGYGADYLDKFGTLSKKWTDRLRQVYEGVYRGVSSYNWYVGSPGAETSTLTKIGALTSTGQLTVGLAGSPNIHKMYGTGCLEIPVGTLAQKPLGSNGRIRYNTDMLAYEGFSDSGWKLLDFTNVKSGYSGFYSTSATYQRLYLDVGVWYFEMTGARSFCVRGRYYSLDSTETLAINGAPGKRYFYYDYSGNLNIGTTGFDFANTAVVAVAYWDGTVAHSLGWELHGMTEAEDHYWKHTTVGTRYVSGFEETSAPLPVGTPVDDTTSYFHITGGRLLDEDIKVDVVHTIAPAAKWDQDLGSGLTSATAGRFPILYVNASNLATYVAPDSNRYPFLYSGANGVPQYINTGVPTDPADGEFVVYWVLGTSTQLYGGDGTSVFLRPHNQSYPTVVDARTASTSELDWTSISLAEAKTLYRFIFQVDSTWTLATHRCKIVEVYDYRFAAPIPIDSAGGPAPSDHLILTNLNGGQYSDGGHFNLATWHAALVAPTVNDDIDNYKVGSLWIDNGNAEVYINRQNTNAAAIWTKFITDGGNTGNLTIGTSTGNLDILMTASGARVTDGSSDYLTIVPNAITIGEPVIDPASVHRVYGTLEIFPSGRESTDLTLYQKASFTSGSANGDMALALESNDLQGNAILALTATGESTWKIQTERADTSLSIYRSISKVLWGKYNAGDVSWNLGIEFGSGMQTAHGYSRIVSPGQSATPTVNGGTYTLQCAQKHIHYLSAPGTGGATITVDINSISEGQTVNVLFASSGSSYTITWATGVKWNILGIPTPTTTASRYDMYTFIKIGGVIFGAAVMGMN
jgi:hypothetical protein